MRQWVTDTSNPGWQGYGRIVNGYLVDVTDWRRLPAAPAPPPVQYLQPPAFGGCANGQCGMPQYSYYPGHFGFR